MLGTPDRESQHAQLHPIRGPVHLTRVCRSVTSSTEKYRVPGSCQSELGAQCMYPYKPSTHLQSNPCPTKVQPKSQRRNRSPPRSPLTLTGCHECVSASERAGHRLLSPNQSDVWLRKCHSRETQVLLRPDTGFALWFLSQANKRRRSLCCSVSSEGK